jgi:phosphatidate cytidylyltransferase
VLKLRILSALVAAPLVLGAIFLLDLGPLAVVFAGLAGLALVEWARLAGIEGVVPTAGYLVVFGAAACFLWFVPQSWPAVLSFACAAWVIAALAVVRFPASGRWLPRPVLVLAGWMLLIPAWLGLVAIMRDGAGPWLLLWLFVLVWGADIGAYFAGRAFGRRKLAPAVSPGKTWEGVAGGVLLAVAAGAACIAWIPALGGLGWRPSTWLVLMVVIVAVSIFGDLFESVLKRLKGVKDSGRLFPGHGGMLDRIDSLIAALPFLAIVVASS